MLPLESMVERRRITCPETGDLEDVELDRTPLGLVVTSCSRDRDGALACPRECARRIDRRERADAEDRERVVLILESWHDSAARVASALVLSLGGDGLIVEPVQLGARSLPPLEDYDAVVIGARARFGRHARAVIKYIREHRDVLAAMPAFFYSVGGHGVVDRDSYVQRMKQRTGWSPTLTASFDDANQEPEIRAFARHIADEIPSPPALA